MLFAAGWEEGDPPGPSFGVEYLFRRLFDSSGKTVRSANERTCTQHLIYVARNRGKWEVGHSYQRNVREPRDLSEEVNTFGKAVAMADKWRTEALKEMRGQEAARTAAPDRRTPASRLINGWRPSPPGVSPPVPPPVVLRPSAKLGRRRPRDDQQALLYEWEHDIYPDGDEPTLDDDEIRHLVSQVCADYELPQIPVITDSGRHFSVFMERPLRKRGRFRDDTILMHHKPSGREYEVWLEIAPTYQHRRPSIVLHELGHYIADYTYGFRATPGHGEEFATILAGLYSHYMGADRSAITAAAERRGLRFAPIA